MAGSSADTWVIADRTNGNENPLAGLVDFITEQELAADALLCPGDLCNKAAWDALPYVWRTLEDVATALGTTTLIATAGNHDIDSRGLHAGLDVVYGLAELGPGFPAQSEEASIEYWQNRICVVRAATWQIVVLNSTIMRYLSESESDQGCVNDDTLAQLRSKLRDTSFPVNILLCHHHPLPSTHLDPTDRSQMDGGDRLVRLLDEMDNRWLVVHGHKHEPALDQLGGTGNAPIRLASASVGANLIPVLAAHVRNQFHLVELPLERLRVANVRLGGHVDSFTWQPRTGWRRAVAEEGLPGRASFGYWHDGESLARDIFVWAQQQRLVVLDRQRLLGYSPVLEFMLPSDQQRWARELERLGCYVSYDMNGVLQQVVLP